MAWRVDKSLLTFRDQVNELFPNRDKASDGTIGDAAHSAEGTGSDHNPNANGVVCAIDITHDPDHGLDIADLANSLFISRDSRIKYIIWNGQTVDTRYGWYTQKYYGTDGHYNHLHLSVYPSDDTTPWNIGQAKREDNEMITKEQYIVGAEAVGTVYGKDFNYDPNLSTDQFLQFLNGQAPVITKDIENKVADSITGVKNVIGWEGYNSPFVGQKVATHYPQMVQKWVDYAQANKKPGTVQYTKEGVKDWLAKNL